MIPLNFFLGSLILTRGYRILSNRYFGISTVFISLWAVGDILLLGTRSQGFVDVGYYLFTIGPMFTALYLVLFTFSFQSKVAIRAIIKVALYGVTSLFAVLIALKHDLLITSVTTSRSGLNQVHVSRTGWTFYALFFSSLFLISYFELYRHYKQAAGLRRSQVTYVAGGIFLTSFSALLTNLMAPILGYSRLLWLGPLFTLFYLVLTVTAIVRHHLFDIRFVIARTLGYLATLIALSTIYGFLLFGSLQFILGQHFAIRVQILLSAATGVVSLGLPSLKRFFDRATNKLFYRDAYEPQAFFDEINRILVTTTDLRKLLQAVTAVIAANLKSEFCIIGIQDENVKRPLIIGTVNKSFTPEDIEEVRHMTPHIHQSVIVTDYLPEQDARLKELLLKNDIALLTRLTSNYRNTHEGLGYVLLGTKKSGNPYSTQDVKILDTISNGLIVAIQNALHFEEIQNFNLTLQEKVEAATKELRHSNEKLKALDETKDDFISMASHQLRTPLTSVKGYVSLVLDGDAGKISTQQRKLLNQAFTSSQRMVYLISDLLNVSRLKTGKFVIEQRPVNLSEMITDELAQLAETASSRSINLKYDKPHDFPVLMLDETKTRQVIMNFVDNAIYYTPANGTIIVQLINKPETIELRVVDDGIGVPKAEMHHLFTKFYRAGNARKARPDGTGLGLFMAKKVVAAQGGAILFESQEGKGSTFGFTFSKSKLAVKPESPAATPKTAIAK